MNLSQFNAALGAYYRKYSPQVDPLILNGFTSRPTFALIPGVKDQYISSAKKLEKAIQPYLRGFTPHANKMEIMAEINSVKKAKINYAIDSDDIDEMERSQLGDIMTVSLGTGAAKLAPSIATLVFNGLLDTANDELELEISYTGEFSAPTLPVPGEPGEAVDGIKKKIDGYIADGKVIPFALGNYTTDDVLDYVEEFVKMLPEELRTSGKPITLEVSDLVHLSYWENRRRDFGPNTDYNSTAPLTVLNYSNITLKRIAGMRGSKRIITTIPGNKIMVTDQEPEMQMLGVELKESDGEVRMFSNFKLGFGYRFSGIAGSTNLRDQLIWTNDVD